MIDILTNLPLLCGTFFLLTALLLKWFPPRKMNSLYGYRTSASMQSPEHWHFAQGYSTARMFEAAVLLLLLGSAYEFVPLTLQTRTGIGIAALLAVTIYIIVRTEYALKRKFPQ